MEKFDADLEGMVVECRGKGNIVAELLTQRERDGGSFDLPIVQVTSICISALRSLGVSASQSTAVQGSNFPATGEYIEGLQSIEYLQGVCASRSLLSTELCQYNHGFRSVIDSRSTNKDRNW